MTSPKRKPKNGPNYVRRRLAVVGTLLVAIAIAALLIWNNRTQSDANSRDDDNRDPSAKIDKPADPPHFPLPPIGKSRFLNTSADVEYVGNAECIQCHRDEYDSYLKTAHSLALSDIDLANEPPDGEVHHKLSGRRYRVYRERGKLRHREFLRLKSGKEIVLADYPMRYAIGSGRHSRGYIVEIDGFLTESPLTFYASKQRWDMSPGYAAHRLQKGFSRPVLFKCVLCHSGRVKPRDNSFHRLDILEKTISCERCHGPGGLHVRQRKAGIDVKGDIDRSIVNLVHLSRKRQEDVCSQCHLSNTTDVENRGREISDFRPGLKLSDFRTGYRLKDTGSSMTVVGHMQQMRLSPCYLESNSFTCTTCHNPHFSPKPAAKLNYYRKKCLSCHSQEKCGLPLKQRIARQPRDNCVACHMPKTSTEIAHVAFTHHRVGIHRTTTAEKPKTPHGKPGTLIPTDDVLHLPQIDRDRTLALAYFELARSAKNEESMRVYQGRALELLLRVRGRGLRDPVADTALAYLHWQSDPDRCISFAKSALKQKTMPLYTHAVALSTLATSYFGMRQYDRAIPILQQLVKIHRSFDHWKKLAVCQQRKGDLNGALKAALMAAKLAPGRVSPQMLLVRIYRQLKQPKLAQQHLDRAKLLENAPQQE